MESHKTRREAIIAIGGLGLGAAYFFFRGDHGNGSAPQVGGSTASRAGAGRCSLTPELTEGPYYIASEPFRRNVTEGKPGVPLKLVLRVEDADTCAPIRNATVEIWHADADGNYSGFGSTTSNTTFLRGQQRTNNDGEVRFKTIYPGWYVSRTAHIHCKVHVSGNTVHTGQLFFKDRISDKVYDKALYAERGERDTTNATDNLFAGGGSQSVVRLRKPKRGKGYRGELTLAVSQS